MMAKHYHETETRIFCRLTAREPIVELLRIPHGGTDTAISDIIGNLPEQSSVVIMDRAIDPARILRRSGRHRLRCDVGRVRQDFAAIQAHACEAGVMFV